jgi:hypothetical protein
MWLLVAIAVIGLMMAGRMADGKAVTRLLVTVVSLLSILGVMLYFWKGRIGVMLLLGLYVIILIATPIFWAVNHGTILAIGLLAIFVGNVAIILDLINTLKECMGSDSMKDRTSETWL